MDEGYEIALQKTLEATANEFQSDRCYFFNFHGHHITYSHEWVNENTPPFKEVLGTIECNDLPFFVRQLRKGDEVIAEVNDLENRYREDAAKELYEMKRENINSLALVPIHYNGREENSIAGFIGVDYCFDKNSANLPVQMLTSLKDSGNFLFTLQTLFEINKSSGHLLPWMKSAHIDYERRKQLTPHLLSYLSSNPFLFPLCAKFILPPPSLSQTPQLPSPSVVSFHHQRDEQTSLQQSMGKLFQEKKYALLNANVYTNNSVSPQDLHDLRYQMLKEIRAMDPDIEPYTTFRNVGYIRYMYRYGSMLPLKHKQFFQVDPSANVLLNSKPRPFSKLSKSLVQNRTLHHIIRTLIEDIWSGDLGPEVHVAVHPLQIRNFHEGEIHNEVYATFEGTHIDSTERVAVVMLDRLNVAKGTAKTSLYHHSCAIGLRRDNEEDEKILAPLRIEETILMDAFDTITFDDTQFKHDASDPVPDDPSQPMSRCVILIMCRRPFLQPSPLADAQNHPIDGYTPRLSRRSK